MTAMPNYGAREATADEVTALLDAVAHYEPVVQHARLGLRVLPGLEMQRGPAVSPTAGPRAGLPQPDKSDANTGSDAERQGVTFSETPPVHDCPVSAETYAAVEQAIAAHISAESDEPRMVTDWYLVTASVGDRMERTVYHHVSSSSPGHSLEGLLAKGLRRMTAGEEYGDDE